MLLPAHHDPVDEALEHALLGLLIERPVRVVPAVAVRGAEQVLQTAVRREGIPFEIEEDVAGRRFRQRGESLARLDRRDQLVDAPAFPPRPILHPRLLADPGQRAVAHALDSRDDRHFERRQIRHRRHVARDQPAPLAAGDTGDERQVVVGPALLRARLLPLAEPAVIDRLGVGLRRRPGVRLETAPDGAVVRGVLDHTEARACQAVAPVERQVHPRRLHALHPRQQVRVQQKLQQRLALGAAGQLGVEHLVRPAAQRARGAHPEQEVGVAAPAPILVLQAPLVDHVDPAPHRLRGALGGVRAVLVRERCVGRGDSCDAAAVGRELFQQALLVLDPALLQNLSARVVVRRRRLDLAARDGAAQARQVAAGEVAAEIGGRELQPAVGVAHRAGR